MHPHIIVHVGTLFFNEGPFCTANEVSDEVINSGLQKFSIQSASSALICAVMIVMTMHRCQVVVEPDRPFAKGSSAHAKLSRGQPRA